MIVSPTLHTAAIAALERAVNGALALSPHSRRPSIVCWPSLVPARVPTVLPVPPHTSLSSSA